MTCLSSAPLNVCSHEFELDLSLNIMIELDEFEPIFGKNVFEFEVELC